MLEIYILNFLNFYIIINKYFYFYFVTCFSFLNLSTMVLIMAPYFIGFSRMWKKAMIICCCDLWSRDKYSGLVRMDCKILCTPSSPLWKPLLLQQLFCVINAKKAITPKQNMAEGFMLKVVFCFFKCLLIFIILKKFD